MIRSNRMRARSVSRSLFMVACGAIGLASPATSYAADVDWDNSAGNSNWNTAQNWSTDVVPVAPDDAVFINPAVGPANITADIPAPRDIRFGSDGRTGSGTVNHSAGTANIGGWLRMGINTGSGGTYNLSGGTLEAGRYNLAESGGSTSTVNLTGGTLRQRDAADIGNGDNWSRIGQDGAATFNVSAGTASFDARVIVAGSGTSTATITQTGGVLEVRRGEFTLGDQGTATYNITGGTLRALNPDNGNGDTSGNITVGQWDNSNGRMTVSGGAIVEAAAQFNLADGRVEFPSRGQVDQSGGTVRVGTAGVGDLRLARTTSGTGIYNLTGGVLDLTGGDIIYGDGTAAFTMTGGELRNVRSTDFSFSQSGGTFVVGQAGSSAPTTIGGNFTLGPTGTLLVGLAAGGVSGASNLLDVNGIATLSGLLALDAPSAALLPVGTQLTILSPDSAVVGTFANGGLLFADNNQIFTINYAGGDGNDIVLTATNRLVPEPSVVSLLGLAAGAGLMRRRARRR